MPGIFGFGLKFFKHLVSGRAFSSRDYGLSDLLMYARMIDPSIILQTDGSFLCAFWFRGQDMETSTDQELAILSAKLNNAFNLLGSSWMFHVDTLRYRATEYIREDECFFPNATSLLIDTERRRLYQDEPNHFENVYVISFTYKPRIDLGSKIGLFFRNIEHNESNNDFSYHLKYYKNKVAEVSDLLTHDLNLSMMSSNELISYLSWCLTGEAIDIKFPVKYRGLLKHLLASKDLVGGESPKIGDKHIRAITIMGFPSESYPGILDKLNYVDFEYRWNTRFILIGQYEGSKMIDKISNLWYQKRISAMDTLKISLSVESNIKVDQSSESNYIDATEAKFLNESGNVKFGFYTATVIVMDEDANIAERNARQIRSIFQSLGFQSQTERHHSIEAFLGSLPGYSYANVRKWLIHSLNVADIMPGTAIWSGFTHNPCSFYQNNNPPLFYARTNGYTPLRVSLHVEDNGHTLVLGPTGSGKSTFLNFMIAQHFRYQNARVFVFDKNRSSLPLCYAMNGNFYDIGEEMNSIYFQPLSNLEGEFDFDFVTNWVEELCKLNGLHERFNDNHRKSIIKALNLMKQETSKERRTISYLRHLVQDWNREIAGILDIFSQESREIDQDNSSGSGIINKIFDANTNLLELNKSRFTVFEMSKLMKMGDRIIIPALRYLIHVLSKQFDSCEPTLIVFDESFLFFKHPLFRERIIEWVKTVRKFNVAIIFATTELNDLFKYDDLRSSLKTNCATKIFLPNSRALNEDIAGHYQDMGLNSKQIGLIAEALKGEYFYMSDLGNRKFTLDLASNQATFAYVARTSNEDIKKALEIYQNFPAVEFGYHWLKECGVDQETQKQWLKYNNGVKNGGK